MTPRHEELRKRYVADLREAKSQAERWWEEHAKARAGSKAKRDVAFMRRWPDGPASHPFVIAVIQKYLKACDQLNDLVDDDDFVPLNWFIVDRLDEKDSADLAKFTKSLSYWPIGLLDEEELV
jgi:hypothetical protein